MILLDRATIGGTRTTRDGYLVAEVSAARTGIQRYSGSEVGRPDLAFVDVYRPAEEVFAPAALASYAFKPVTMNHPSENVTAANWKDYAKGIVDGEVKWDSASGHVRVPMMIADAAAIKAVNDGQREISMGYECRLEFVDGFTDDGQPFQAVQRDMRMNHLAIVSAGRAGPECRIGDNQGERTVATKTITFDGLPVEVTDAGEAVINKLLGQVATASAALSAADAKAAALITDAAAKDAEIATLKQAVTDAKVTPAQMRDAAKGYAATIDRAKKLAPAAAITDAMDEAAIKATVVRAKLGDAAKDWTDAQIDVSFATMAAGLGDAKPDALRALIVDGVANLNDAQSARDKALAARNARFQTAHSGAAAA